MENAEIHCSKYLISSESPCIANWGVPPDPSKFLIIKDPPFDFDSYFGNNTPRSTYSFDQILFLILSLTMDPNGKAYCNDGTLLLLNSELFVSDVSNILSVMNVCALAPPC